VDKAGQSYWNEHWETIQHDAFRPESPLIRNYRDRAVANLIARALYGLPSNATVLEAGCADSSLLVYLGRRGNRIVGIDYSAVGCERFRRRATAEGIEAQVECCDIFSPPQSLFGIADCVLSYGLVEHFEDTATCIQALRAFVRPGGRILTIIPNMRGLVGLLQKMCAPSVYAVHMPLTVQELAAGHADGLVVSDCGYLLPAGFGVVNYHEPGSSRASLLLRRLAVAGLGRLTWASWFLDKYISLPRSQILSPYCYCIAERTYEPAVIK
jgi:2-polyprenyl-3-methyl-5-hydroxy-6-metoxy-1,4-benzoquinol methylase